MASLQKNVASQHIKFVMLSATTGGVDASATVTVWVTKDAGAQASGGGTVSNLGNGQYDYAPTQGETNATDVGFLFTATGDIPVHYDFHTDVVDSNGYPSVNVIDWSAQAVSVDSNNVPNVSAKYWAGTAITATSIPVATAAGAAGGLTIAGSNAATTFASGSHFIGTVDTVTTLTNLPAIPNNWLTASGIASGALVVAVWDGAISGHTTAGTFGGSLNAAGSAGDPWATSIPGSYTAGTAGFILGSYLTAAPPTTSQIATALLVTPANKLATDSSGGVLVGSYESGQSPASQVSGLTVAGVALLTAIRYIGAAVSGKSSGAGTGTETYVDFAGGNAFIVTIDGSGDRTGFTYS